MIKPITQKQLEAIVERINVLTDSPIETYINDGTKYVSQVGNFHLSWAYGGVSLHRIVNDKGGISDVFSCGYVPKRDLDNRMWAFITGLSHAKTVK